jgi:hypothetical protein
MRMKFFTLFILLIIPIILLSSCSKNNTLSNTIQSETASATETINKEVPISEIEKNKTDWQQAYDRIDSNYRSGENFPAYPEELNALQIKFKNSKMMNSNVVKDVEIQVKDNLLRNLLENKWNIITLDQLLGKNDSTFRKYRIYFKQGIDVKILNNKISNILFNSRYKGSIMNEINMKSSKADVLSQLGQPNFENTDENLYGYKTDNFYIFFTGRNQISEVSVYRRDANYDQTALVAAIKELEKSKDSLEPFKNSLKEKWPDLDWYFGISAEFGMAYGSRGIYG